MTIESARFDQRPIATAAGWLGAFCRAWQDTQFFAFGNPVIVLARGLGRVDCGIYGVIMAVLLWVEQTSRFTIFPALAFFRPRHREEQITA